MKRDAKDKQIQVHIIAYVLDCKDESTKPQNETRMNEYESDCPLQDQVRAQEASEASMFEAHQTIGNTKAKVQGIEGGVIAQIAASRITSPTPLAMARPPLPAPGAKVSEAPFRAEPLKRSRGPGAVAEDN